MALTQKKPEEMTLEEKRALARQLLAQRNQANQAMAEERAESLQQYTEHTYDEFMYGSTTDYEEAESFQQWVEQLREQDAYFFEVPRAKAQRPEVELANPSGEPRPMLNFSSYNYLGFGFHPDVLQAAKDALDTYGLGACSSPVISGTFSVHKALEDKLVEFYGLPDRGVSLFSSGYGVNTGTLSALMKQGHHIVLDQLAHASLVEGAQLSGARVHYFEHNDVDHLERVLQRINAKENRTLVCTEGVFSADGDFGNIAGIARVAKAHRAKILVDEAHSVMLTGPNGRGAAEQQGALDQVDLMVITFSKAFGGVGGALIAPQPVIQYVNWYARCRMFSCALDPAVTGGILKALELGMGDAGRVRRERLQANVAALRERLAPHVTLVSSDTWVMPVLFGSEKLTIPLNKFLHDEGLDTSIMQYPAVNRGEARIRMFVTSEHTEAQIDRAAEIIRKAATRFGFLR